MRYIYDGICLLDLASLEELFLAHARHIYIYILRHTLSAAIAQTNFSSPGIVCRCDFVCACRLVRSLPKLAPGSTTPRTASPVQDAVEARHLGSRLKVGYQQPGAFEPFVLQGQLEDRSPAMMFTKLTNVQICDVTISSISAMR